MRKLLGPHLGGQWTSNLDTLRKWQPPLILLLQPQLDKVALLREACPGAIIVGRFYHDDSHYANNIAVRPKEFAREIHNEIISNPVTPLLDYVQSNNETNQTWDGIQQLNEYSLEWMALADQSQVYKCAILAFSVGNPDLPHKPGDPAGYDGRMLYWQQVLPSLNYAQQRGHILLLHAYGYPSMFAPDPDWYIYRYERQVQANLRTLGITKLKYAYGEIGIDRLIVADKGGYKIVVNDQDYTNQLLQWERDQQGQELLLGGAIFTLGDSGGWGTYDISGNVASMLAAHYADHAKEYEGKQPMPHAPDTDAPPAKPSALPAQITDDFKRRVPDFTAATPQPGQRYYRLIKAEYVPDGARRFGPDHHILVDVLDADGKRKMDASVNFYWADGMHIDRVRKVSEPYGVDYGMTSAGHGFGVWVGDFQQLSDNVFGMGLGTIEQPDWNHHVTYYLVFQEAIAQPATTPATTHLPSVSATAPIAAYVIAQAGANLRQTPDVRQGNIITAIAHGEPVTVTDYKTAGNGTRWAQANYQGASGWIAADLLGATRPQRVVTPAPQPTQPSGDNWSRSIAFVRRWEGGWADNPNDSGGATNKGITIGTYTRWRDAQGQPEPTKDDLRAISDAEVSEIYRQWYWQASGADRLPWPLALAQFDTAVNAGVGKAQEMLQRSNGNFLAYMGHLIDFYTRIDDFEHFGRAWIRRRADLLLEASK